MSTLSESYMVTEDDSIDKYKQMKWPPDESYSNSPFLSLCFKPVVPKTGMMSFSKCGNGNPYES